MSKELEALEIECGELVEMDLLFLDRNGENQEKWRNSEAFKKAIEFEKKYGKSHTYILKQALQRLEAIDNAKPSEALGSLHKIASKVELADNDDYWEVRNAYAKVENTLLKAQEQEKVLEIIKEKSVDVGYLRNCDNKEEYNLYISNYDNNYWHRKELTQEEFDLLKEVIGYE